MLEVVVRLIRGVRSSSEIDQGVRSSSEID